VLPIDHITCQDHWRTQPWCLKVALNVEICSWLIKSLTKSTT
jgi:hypothetical protein